MMPQVSVVVATRDGAATLPRLLRSLASQTMAADQFEVIVVADGCRDDTVAVARGQAVAYPLQVVSQSGSGAATARNFGARLARAPLLVFLDDDMEALPGLLAAHRAAQVGQAGVVGLGYFSLPLQYRGEAPLELTHALWWDAHFSRLFSGSHRMTFQDLLSGNLAVPRSLFDTVGGFDEAFMERAGEDHELGARLMARGVPFRFIPDAACLHHEPPTLARYASRAFAEGRGHVLLARKHPALAPLLPLSSRNAPWSDAAKLHWLRRHPGVMGMVGRLSAPAAEMAGAVRLRGSWSKLFRMLLFCSYWRGVVYECGSPQAADRLLKSLSGAAPPPVVRAEIDLARDLSGLADLLTRQAVDELVLRHGEDRIGTIAARPGAEALRLGHVRYALAHEHGEAWRWAVMAQSGSPTEWNLLVNDTGERNV